MYKYYVFTWKTVHTTTSKHPGVVKDPWYLKKFFVSFGNKSAMGIGVIETFSFIGVVAILSIAVIIGSKKMRNISVISDFFNTVEGEAKNSAKPPK